MIELPAKHRPQVSRHGSIFYLASCVADEQALLRLATFRKEYFAVLRERIRRKTLWSNKVVKDVLGCTCERDYKHMRVVVICFRCFGTSCAVPEDSGFFFAW